jgi:indolepyruvate ferredoxin oxidoreductase, beta subunit
MTFDMILTGVGGQGVLSTAMIIAEAAIEAGLRVKQSEIHGMSQRGGSVVAHLRLSDQAIGSAIVGLGTADMILGAEALETIRCMPYLSMDGWAVVSQSFVKTAAGYPAPDSIEAELHRFSNLILLDAEGLARKSGSARAANTVLLGAASTNMPIPFDVLAAAVSSRFAAKGDRILDANATALNAGRLVAESRRSPAMAG